MLFDLSQDQAIYIHGYNLWLEGFISGQFMRNRKFVSVISLIPLIPFNSTKI